VKTSLVPYRVAEGDFDAFVAYPEGAGPHPAILICHMWGGRDAFAEDKARALAELGYVGAAIDLYGVGKRGTTRDESQALMSALVENPAELRRRLRAAYETVCELSEVDGARVGAIGFCFGGMCAILCARMGLAMRGVVSFHGLLKIGEPLDAKVVAPILVLHGQDDPMVPPGELGRFAEEMKRVNAEWQLHAYPGVMHAFTNPAANDPSFGTVYDEEADQRSWREMVFFFEEVMG